MARTLGSFSVNILQKTTADSLFQFAMIVE